MEKGLTMAERVEFFRRRAKLSQRALSIKADIARGTVVALENGELTNPQLDTLRAIARVCGCDVRELISDTDLRTAVALAVGS